MTPTAYAYLAYYQPEDTLTEPIGIGDYLPLDTGCAYEPAPAELGPGAAKHVLGTQGRFWTDYFKEPKKVEYTAFPRFSTLAEVAWTPREP